MPFWLQENKPVVCLKSLPLTYKFLILGGLVCFVVGFWLFGFYFPIKNSLILEQQKYSQLCNLKKSVNSQILCHKNLKDENKSSTDKLKKIIDQMGSLQQVISTLLSGMKQSKVACRGIRLGDGISRNFYIKHDIFLKGKSCFANILSFLEGMEKKLPAAYYKEFMVSKGKRGLLSFNLKMRVMCKYDEVS